MMVGLGGGRRAARSVPVLLLLLALGACLAFLGLSSWVWRARGAELQLLLSGLEAKSRRAEADKSAAELQSHQLQLHLHNQAEEHRKQLGQLSELHRQQHQAEAAIYTEQKEVLNRNITSSRRTIEKLQDQFQDMQREYSQLDQKLQELQKKLTYDVTQCSNQIRDQKELYEEQIKELNHKLARTAKTPSDSKPPEEADQKISITFRERTDHKPMEKQKETVKPSLKPQERTKEQASPGEVHSENELEEKKKAAKEVETNQILEDTGVLEDANATREDYDDKARKAADMKDLTNRLMNNSENDQTVNRNDTKEGQGGLLDVEKFIVKPGYKESRLGADVPGIQLNETLKHGLEGENQENVGLGNGTRQNNANINQDGDEGFVDNLRLEETEDYDGDEGNVAEFEADKEAELAGDTQGQGIKDTRGIEQDENDQKVPEIL